MANEAKTPTLDDVIAEETLKLEAEDAEPKEDVQTEDTGGEGDPDTAGDSGQADAEDDEPARIDPEPYVEETPPVTQDLPADVKTFVDEKLPDVEVWGRDGEGNKVQKFIVKSAFDLPDDFIPRSYKDQQIQGQQFAKQDRLQAKLEDDFIQIQADNQRAESQRQLEASWSIELKGAQASGRIPEVKKEAPGDPGFDKASEVIEFMKVENDKLSSINAPYRIQSFTQALDLYEANSLKTNNEEKVSAEDAKKSKQGSMIGGGRSTKDNFSQVPKAGTKLEDILAEFA